MEHQPELVAAAAAVLAKYGWEGFSLERVAEAAGISRVTLYRRGATRESLVEALSEMAARVVHNALWPALTGSGSAAERLDQALKGLCEAVEGHLDVLAGLSSAPDPVFHLDEPTRDVKDVFVAPLERILRDGQIDGTLSVDDPRDDAVLLFNVVTRTYLHLRIAHDWGPDKTERALLRLARSRHDVGGTNQVM